MNFPFSLCSAFKTVQGVPTSRSQQSRTYLSIAITGVAEKLTQTEQILKLREVRIFKTDLHFQFMF